MTELEAKQRMEGKEKKNRAGAGYGDAEKKFTRRGRGGFRTSGKPRCVMAGYLGSLNAFHSFREN